MSTGSAAGKSDIVVFCDHAGSVARIRERFPALEVVDITGGVPPGRRGDVLFGGWGRGTVDAMAAGDEPWRGSLHAQLVNAALHRHLAGRGVSRADRAHRLLGTAALLGISLAVTSGALAVAMVLDRSSLVAALIAVTLANGVAAVARFWVLRAWVFRPHYGTTVAGEGQADPSSPDLSVSSGSSTAMPRGV